MVDTIDSKKKMLQALETSLGIVTTAAEISGVGRSTHYLWMNEDPEYRAAVEALDDVVLDMSESALHKNIKAGDTASIIFHLKTKGKRRGYIERTQVETKEVSKFGDMSDEELDGFIEASKL
jgi:hypothetical protein